MTGFALAASEHAAAAAILAADDQPGAGQVRHLGRLLAAANAEVVRLRTVHAATVAATPLRPDVPASVLQALVIAEMVSAHQQR